LHRSLRGAAPHAEHMRRSGETLVSAGRRRSLWCRKREALPFLMPIYRPGTLAPRFRWQFAEQTRREMVEADGAQGVRCAVLAVFSRSTCFAGKRTRLRQGYAGTTNFQCNWSRSSAWRGGIEAKRLRVSLPSRKL